MRKIKPKKFAFFMILFTGVFLGTWVLADADKDFYLEIPTAPFDVSGGFENIRNEFIYCLAGQKNDIIDSNGNVIATESSAFFGGNPWTTFSLIDEKTGKDVEQGGFNVRLEFKCQTSGQALPESSTNPSSFDLFNFPSVDIPLTVESGVLIVKVFSKDATGNLVETWNGKLNIKQTDITTPNAVIIGETSIKQQDILKYLPIGTYQSWQHITIQGNLDVHWRDFPNPSYRYVIEVNEQFSGDGTRSNVDADLITYRLINVDIPVGTEQPKELPADCDDNEIFVNGFCIKSGGNNQPSSNTQVFNPLGESGERFGLCMQSQGFACLLHQEFVGFTLFGIASIIGLGAVVSGLSNKAQNTSRPDIYGMGYR